MVTKNVIAANSHRINNIQADLLCLSTYVTMLHACVHGLSRQDAILLILLGLSRDDIGSHNLYREFVSQIWVSKEEMIKRHPQVCMLAVARHLVSTRRLHLHMTSRGRLGPRSSSRITLYSTKPYHPYLGAVKEPSS